MTTPSANDLVHYNDLTQRTGDESIQTISFKTLRALALSFGVKVSTSVSESVCSGRFMVDKDMDFLND